MSYKIKNKWARSVSYSGDRSYASVKYIVIHYTGNNGDTAKANANYFATSNTRSAGAHFFVDQDGEIYQSIKMTKTAWSVGGYFSHVPGGGSYYKKCTNSNSVSIELCDIAKKSPSNDMINATAWLIRHIQACCPNAKTIIRHFDVNNKLCPATMINAKKWANFKKAITGGIVLKKDQVVKCYTSTGKYKVIKVPRTVRENPSASAKVATYIRAKNTVYTITETQKHKNVYYGKLKSGAGWICLRTDYVKKV